MRTYKITPLTWCRRCVCAGCLRRWSSSPEVDRASGPFGWVGVRGTAQFDPRYLKIWAVGGKPGFVSSSTTRTLSKILLRAVLSSLGSERSPQAFPARRYTARRYAWLDTSSQYKRTNRSKTAGCMASSCGRQEPNLRYYSSLIGEVSTPTSRCGPW